MTIDREPLGTLVVRFSCRWGMVYIAEQDHDADITAEAQHARRFVTHAQAARYAARMARTLQRVRVSIEWTIGELVDAR